MAEIDINDYITWDGYDEENGKQFNIPFPRCNHTKGITKYNIGYVQGYLDYDRPFEAEVFANEDDELWLAVVLPCTNVNINNIKIKTEEKNNTDENSWDKSVLTLGMQKVEITLENTEDNIDYADLMMENNLFYMSSEGAGRLSLGDCEYYLDDESNLLVKAFVALRCDNLNMCYTDLDLMDFPIVNEE